MPVSRRKRQQQRPSVAPRPSSTSMSGTEQPQRSASTDRPSPLSWILLAVGVLVFVVAIGGLLLSTRRPSTLVGPLVQGNPPAPDFTLPDQDGKPVHLAGLRGKVVAVTFLYTNCLDVCPLIAGKLAQAQQQLGKDASKVEILAVSVDPVHDTPEAVKRFDDEHHVGPGWHYLIGHIDELRPVWLSYGIGTDAASVKAGAPDPEQLDHTAIIYMIDRQQRLRLALDSNFTIPDFVQDVQVLSRE